jgi:hypothetical protein
MCFYHITRDDHAAAHASTITPVPTRSSAFQLASPAHLHHKYCNPCDVTLQDGVDPFAGMSERERKLAELQARLRQSRKANQNAVIAERRREKVGTAGCPAGTAQPYTASGAAVPWTCGCHRLRHKQQAN